jgi:hypothetical protein
MEKYLIVLIILMLLAFSVCTFSIFDKEPDKVYAVVDDDLIADKLLKNSEKWQTNGYYVYKVSEDEIENINKIPGAEKVKEYISPKANNIDIRNPYLQTVSSGGVTVTGIPYVID